MDDCNSNQSSTNPSPMLHSTSFNHPISDLTQPLNTSCTPTNNINNTDYISHYNTGRLSKVTEENSHHNNSTQDTDEENEFEQQVSDVEYTTNNDTLSVSINNNPISNIRYYTQTINRHNNTPHTNDDEHTNSSYSYSHAQPNEFIPERIRMLLDRFAANGYIISNAPPPATHKIIENIPEIIVDKKFMDDIDENENECSICKIQIEMEQKLKILTCKHYFHSRCIITWLYIHASCPLCRYQLPINNNNNNMTSGVSETMVLEDANTRSIQNRLQDLRRRRRNRRTLNDGNTYNEIEENNNNNMEHAASQLLTAVCDILTNYTRQNEGEGHNIAERVVRFNIKPPPPPHSSRSNTKTRNSLPDLPLSPVTLVPMHKKHYSSPSNSHHNIMSNVEDNNNNNNNNKICINMEENKLECNEDPISAKKIKQDFAKWMKRRSRLDSTPTNVPSRTKSPELTPDLIYSASTSQTNSINNNPNPKQKRTIIYNSNYNQNYIYNNNYNSIDEDDGKLSLNMFSSNATTPSPSTRNSKYNNKLPPNYTLTLGTECSNLTNQTFISPPFSGQNSPNINGNNYNYNTCNPYDNIDGDECSNSFNLSSPSTTMNDVNIYGFMNNEQLEIAEKRHKNVILKQQYIINQIQSEENKRLLNSFWKCSECKKNQRSFLFLPCRHLGLCTICNSQKLSKINRCSTCNVIIRQKIPINFNEN